MVYHICRMLPHRLGSDFDGLRRGFYHTTYWPWLLVSGLLFLRMLQLGDVDIAVLPPEQAETLGCERIPEGGIALLQRPWSGLHLAASVRFCEFSLPLFPACLPSLSVADL